MNSIFEFLFKYRPLLFQEADFTFLSPWPVTFAALAALVLVVPALLSYTLARGRTNRTDRWVLGTLRTALFALLFFAVMQPALVLTSIVPQRNFVAVLVDDSRSMTIDDRDGTSRAEKAVGLLDPEGGLVPALEEGFALRYFRFSSSASRMEGLGGLTFDGSRTRLGAALTAARDELQGVPLSAMVVISDGGDNTEEVIGDALLQLRAAAVPVFTVGLGDEEMEGDVQASRADVPATALAGNSLVVNVLVESRGYGGREVPVVVEDMGRIIASEVVTLPRDGQPLVAPVAITLENPGARELTFRIPGLEDERVLENNELRAVRPGSGPHREDPLLRGRAALGGEVHAAGGRRGREPADRPAAAHRREQVLPPQPRRPPGAGHRVPDDPRGALPLPRPHPGVGRGELLHPRPAHDDRGLRERTGRHPAHAGRAARLRGWRLQGHADRGCPPDRAPRAHPGHPDRTARLREGVAHPGRREPPHHPDRRRRGELRGPVGTPCRWSPPPISSPN